MAYELPPKFERTTRWAHVKEGVEIGPFSAKEMLQLLDEGRIGPNTELVEMATRKRCALLEVKPFHDYIRHVLEKDKQHKAEKEFEQTRSRFERKSRAKLITFGIILPVLIAIGVVAWVMFNPFAPKETKNYVITPGEEEDDGKTGEGAKEEAKEPEFKILEADDPSLAGEENDEKVVESVKEEFLLAPSSDTMSSEKKLEALEELPDLPKARSSTRPTLKPVGPAAEETKAAVKESVTTFDFSEEEDEGSSTVSASNEAEKRLSEVLRKCSLNAMYQYQDIDSYHIVGTATLLPDGRFKGVKLTVTPKKHIGDLKMCASAELARHRLPQRDGPATTVMATLTVNAN